MLRDLALHAETSLEVVRQELLFLFLWQAHLVKDLAFFFQMIAGFVRRPGPPSFETTRRGVMRRTVGVSTTIR